MTHTLPKLCVVVDGGDDDDEENDTFFWRGKDGRWRCILNILILDALFF